MSAASGARRVNRGMEAVVYEKDDYVSYAICSVPYYVSDEVKELRT